MTKKEKFKKGVVIERINNDYKYEFWNSSTKYPDEVYYYSDWDDKACFIEDKHQIFQWLLWIASKTQYPFHAKRITEYALTHWYNW